MLGEKSMPVATSPSGANSLSYALFGFLGQPDCSVCTRWSAVDMPVYFSEKDELALESKTVPTHHKMHPDGHSLIKRKGCIHCLGYFF
jgi:hypothetical protein